MIRRPPLFMCLLHTPRNKMNHVANHGGVANGCHLVFQHGQHIGRVSLARENEAEGSWGQEIHILIGRCCFCL